MSEYIVQDEHGNVHEIPEDVVRKIKSDALEEFSIVLSKSVESTDGDKSYWYYAQVAVGRSLVRQINWLRGN